MAQEKTWQPLELIKVTAEYLAGKKIPNPRLDAEILLCDIMGLKRRVDLYAGFERELSEKEVAAYRDCVRRRAAREPVSRILGRREFMGIAFAVTPDVLSPRPETELLVEAVLELVSPKKKAELPDETAELQTPAVNEVSEDGNSEAVMTDELARLLDSYGEDVDDENEVDRAPALSPTGRPQGRAVPEKRPAGKAGAAGQGDPRKAGQRSQRTESAAEIRILDLGTGSGCIAVSLAAHCPGARVLAVDASPKALAVARKNAANANVGERVEFRQGDWFAGCRDGERFDVIVSNPPYLVEGDGEIWPEVARYDPPAALYGGQDGLDCYRRIIPDTPEWLAPEGRIFFEVGAEQAQKVADMLRRRGFREVSVNKDYGGIERVVTGMAPEA